jgi:hypothetical protein
VIPAAGRLAGHPPDPARLRPIDSGVDGRAVTEPSGAIVERRLFAPRWYGAGRAAE